MGKFAVYSHSIAPSIDGVCRRYTAILHELVRRGHDILLFTIETDPEDLPAKNITVVKLDYMIMPAYPGKKVARPTWSNFAKIYGKLLEFQPLYIHMTNDGFSQIFEACALFLGIPLVGAFHTDILELVQRHNGTLFQQGCVFAKEFTDSLILDSCATTSKSFKDKLHGKGINCQHVIITGVDSDMFQPSKFNAKLRNDMCFGDKQGFLCVYTGRISREKRLDVIIDAIQQIDHCYLAIIGDGPSASIYAKLHGKENRIFCCPKFLDHDELADVYASSNIHVSASEFETLGNTVLEAHACGIPVVVPLTQGFRDTVTHDVNGFLFKSGDAADAKQYIERLKKDKKLAKKMGQAGLDAITKCTIEAVVDDLMAWYEEGRSVSSNRPLWKKLLIFILLFLTLPFGIVSLRCYDMLVSTY
jgi:glycosyltransferase involved in cell wall biosynthesis